MMTSILKHRSAAHGVSFGRMLAAVGLAAFFLDETALQAANPEFRDTSPRGGQRGTELKVTFNGNRLSDITQIVFHKPGITAKDVKALDNAKVEATLVIAPDCSLGEHQVRLLGTSGFSYARTFWVGQFPTVLEVEPNDDFNAPQVIPLNVTVEGAAIPEEVDYYRVSAKKGQRLSVEVEGLRINNSINVVAIDPYVAILNKDRFEVAVSDDSALLNQESVISVIIPEDGDYTIEVRDASYQGRGVYRAHISTTPRPLSVYPAGGKAGTEVDFTFIGDPSGKYSSKQTLPAPTDSYYVFGSQNGASPVSGNQVRVSTFDNVLEAEPNDSAQSLSGEAKSLPLAFNGILEKEGDVDWFKFSAKKGERYRFTSFASRLGTPADTVITIFNSKLGSLGSNDDADGSKDSRFDFTSPDDGEYFLQVKDMLGGGGENFVYRVESVPYVKRINVSMPEMLRNDNQYRKQFNIPQGSQYAMVVNVQRENMAGDLVFDFPQLPAGVTWEAGVIPRALTQFPVLLKAAADAPIAGGMYDMLVKNTDPADPLVGKYSQDLDFVRGEPNGTLYYKSVNGQLPIAVTEKAPFSITIDQPKVPIVRDGTMKLKVRAQRSESYKAPINARILWNPPGISSPAVMTIPADATEIEYELNANGSAEINEWKICMLAEADDGKGMITTASKFITLKVEEPFATMKMSMGNVIQGQSGELICTIEHLREFPGEAEFRIFGLPAKTGTEMIKGTKDTQELRFPVTSAEDAPVGQHKNLFATLVFMQNGEAIQQRLGMGGVLRVDPKPKESAKPAAPAAPAAAASVAKSEPPPKPTKPLSRLEQLRLEAQAAEK